MKEFSLDFIHDELLRKRFQEWIEYKEARGYGFDTQNEVVISFSCLDTLCKQRNLNPFHVINYSIFKGCLHWCYQEPKLNFEP